jgi:WD40 repeat protein
MNKYYLLDNPFLITENKKKYSSCIKKLSNHKDEIYCLINLSTGGFATGSADGLVLIWDDYLLDLSLTIHAHKSSVSSICQAKYTKNKENKNILLTGGNDSVIQLWDINDDYNNIKKLKVNGPIINLFYLSNEVFASFTNNQLLLWSIDTYESIYKIEINNIFILEYLADNIFAAGMEDNSIMIFNVFDTKMSHKKELIGNDEIVSCIRKINEKYIISGNYEGNLIVWDLIKMEMFFKIEKAHLYKINCIIQLNNGLFVTCSNDKKIKIWDLHKRINVLSFNDAHEKSIRGIIQLSNGMLVSAGNDSIIKIWN